MNHHSDGEVGVGPTIASLSMGSRATMSFRSKTKDTSRVISVTLQHVRFPRRCDDHSLDIREMSSLCMEQSSRTLTKSFRSTHAQSMPLTLRTSMLSYPKGSESPLRHDLSIEQHH